MDKDFVKLFVKFSIFSLHTSTVHASRASPSRVRPSRASRVDADVGDDVDDVRRVDAGVVVFRATRTRDES